MDNAATSNARRSFLIESLLPKMNEGWLYENGYTVPKQPQRFIAIERSSGDIVWAYGADTLQSLAENIDASETVGVDDIDVWDLDARTQFVPERKIVAFFRTGQRVEVAGRHQLPAQQVPSDFVGYVEAILTRSPYYPTDYCQRTEEIAANSKHVSLAPQPADPWQENPAYPMSAWQAEVANGDTVRGYQDWVGAKQDE